jgi:GT2 family glycosyltransferase
MVLGAATASAPAVRDRTRPVVRGKFIFDGDTKLYIRGVTYGAFRPDEEKREYWDLETIERDFAGMAANGINTVRIPHTMPPRSLLDIALRHGLWVMVGLSAEQYVGYLIDRKGSPDIETVVRDKVKALAGHPALLCYAIGNEIPAYTVRWLGRRRVEKYLHRICRAIKAEDPEGIVTYVNYPTTEYLDLPFLDLVCFNVYLESEDRLEAYLLRLQNIAGNRPLIMSEVGIDSMRNGEHKQAEVLEWQIRTAFACGCAGVFIFSWTDEWHRAGAEVDDWEFGITRRDRTPKAALLAVQKAFRDVPFSSDTFWPRISVVVCSYNGSRTISDCLEALANIRYSDFEVIIVDDGSTDDTAAIASQYDVRLIRTENRGLSHARNLGWQAATGEIVAYTDDDAYPDPHWLHYLALSFSKGAHAAIGGPNIPPPGGGIVAACVANSPGGPVHVLVSDTEAEHIPGCNMAFLRSALKAIGGFDVQFRVAGDDVDLCWRLQQQGWKLGFSPAAQVWHHCRNSMRTYWKQQKGYGKAEALLSAKWPEKYNSSGHLSWQGKVYSPGVTRIIGTSSRIYQGLWGSAPFQSLYQSSPGGLLSLFVMPEWYLVNLALLLIAGLGVLWAPLLWAIPILMLTAGIPVANACKSAAGCHFSLEGSHFSPRMLTAFLHMLQPAARLHGRLIHGLTFWRTRVPAGFMWPVPRKLAIWTEHWQAPEVRLESIAAALRDKSVPLHTGGDYDAWDLEVQGGLWGAARLIMAAEDHGAGTQYVRFRIWPKVWLPVLFPVLVTGGIVFFAARAGAYPVALILSGVAAFLAWCILSQTAAAMAALREAANKQK